MSLSPQQLQELLETSKRLKKPALSVVPSTGAVAAVPFPQSTTPPASSAVASAPAQAPPSAPEPPPSVVPPAPPPEPSSGLEDFSSFSGLAKKQPSLPRGAKNVKCHTIERDPDSGKISKVYTYDYEEEPESGDQISRQREE